MENKTNDSQTSFKYIAGTYKYQKDSVYVEASQLMEKGTYYLYVELDWNNSVINDFTCNIIGYDVKAEEIPHSEFEGFFMNTLKDYARNKVDKAVVNKSDPDWKAKYYLGEDTAGYGFYYYSNYSKTGCTIVEKVKFNKSEGIWLVECRRNDKNIELKPITDDAKQSSFKYLEIKPEKEKFFLFKRIGNGCSTKYNYNTLVKHTAKYLTKLCMKEGKVHKIENEDSPEEIMNYYSLSHDFGQTLVFQNESENTTLDEYINFNKLENLKLTSGDYETSNNENFWKFVVKPKSKVVKHLRRAKVNEASSFSFSIRHTFLKPGESPSSIKEKHCPEKLSDKEIRTIVEEKGEIKSFDDPKTGKELAIYYKAYFFGPFYGFLFKNEEKGYQLDGTFEFKTTNLKIVDPSSSEGNGWDIKLGFGESEVHKIETIKRGESISYSVSMSYFLKKDTT